MFLDDEDDEDVFGFKDFYEFNENGWVRKRFVLKFFVRDLNIGFFLGNLIIKFEN